MFALIFWSGIYKPFWFIFYLLNILYLIRFFISGKVYRLVSSIISNHFKSFRVTNSCGLIVIIFFCNPGVPCQTSSPEDLRRSDRNPRSSPGRSCGAALAVLHAQGPPGQPQAACLDRGSRAGRRGEDHSGQTGTALWCPHKLAGINKIKNNFEIFPPNKSGSRSIPLLCRVIQNSNQWF